MKKLFPVLIICTGSTNFGSPICSVVLCGEGGGTVPYQGTYWVWLGGAEEEIGTVSQDVAIPEGSATLYFQLVIPVCAAGTHTFQVLIDEDVVLEKDNTDPNCNVSLYSLCITNLDAYADNGVHTLMFKGEFTGGGITNFMVDDVSIVVTE